MDDHYFDRAALSWRVWARGLVCCCTTMCVAACSRTGLLVPEIDADVVMVDDAAVPEADPPNDTPTEPDAMIACVAPGDGGPIELQMATPAEVARADVLFVLDKTGSMQPVIDSIQSDLQSVIIPGLAAAIPDLQLGLVTFGDFPIAPYGDPSDVPVTIDQLMTSDPTPVQAAINRVAAAGGGDGPESNVESLYQIATGAGLAPWMPPAECPTIAIGAACLRPDAEPILVMFADAPFHDGVGGANAYDPSLFLPYPPPHTYADTAAALSAINAKVLGINSGVAPYDADTDLLQLAQDSGAIGPGGNLLVFDISPDGTGLSAEVLDAVHGLLAGQRLNVSASASDLIGDGAELISAIQPASANPMSQISSFDSTTFYGVVAGTYLTFNIVLDPARVHPTDVVQRNLVRVRLLSSGVASLGYSDVEIDIPPRGMTCSH